jgi:hypothetical protein
MAQLSTQVRQQIWRGMTRFWSNERSVLSGMIKTDIQAAVNATDTWIDDNAASFNSALPTTFRTNATTVQKTLLFCTVALARVGSTALLQQLLGEVD